MSAAYRFLTPTDVDRFIQIPQTLEVDARSVVLTVEEDTLHQFDRNFLITDYVIYCEAPKSRFLNVAAGAGAMDWKYKVSQQYDPVTNVYIGPHVADAHGVEVGEIANPIINVSLAQNELGTVANSTRFVHYRQCNRFFKYSFKVGDAVTVGSNTVQLYAVYLDSVTGKALPYWRTTDGLGNTQDPEVVEFYYADVGAQLLTDLNGGSAIVSSLDGSAVNVSVIAPPDPEFIDNGVNGAKGGNLAVQKDASGNLVIRAVGEPDASGNPVIQYTASNFVSYTADTNDARALMLYWVVLPTDAAPYMGEAMYAAWSSTAMGPSSGLRPIRDFVDASGNLIQQPSLATEVKEVDKFQFTKDVGPLAALSVRSAMTSLTATDAAARMYLPVSKFVVQHDSPQEPDEGQFDVPFAYEVANATDFNGDARKSIMGGRVMQLVSNYLFDSATNRELGFFPFLLNESKQLTDKIINALASKIAAPSDEVGPARTYILKQIMVKHGKRYFEENAVLNELPSGEKVGLVSSVLSKLDEVFLFFTVTVKTTISNRSKDDVDVLRLIEVPVVVRIYN